MKYMQELQEISGVRAGTEGQSAEQKPHKKTNKQTKKNQSKSAQCGAAGLVYSRHYSKLLQPDHSTLTNTIHPLETTRTGVG